jgi:hypothetical protein
MSTAIEAPPSMSLEEAIKRFVQIQKRYAELAEEKRDVMAVLEPHASALRAGTNTTRLTSDDDGIHLKFEFSKDITLDPACVPDVRELLGDDIFENLFAVKYAPRLRALKPWLASKSPDERLETARQIIRESMREIPRPPSVTIEKNKG